MSRYFIASIVFLILFIGSLSIDGVIEIPLVWYVAIASIYLVLNVIGTCILSFQFYLPVRSRGGNNAIAITFDDGPIPGKTEQILDELKRNNLHATFFCIGERAETQPDLIKRIHNEGHLIGNHSFLHRPTFDLQSSSMITKELADTDITLRNILGKSPKFFRPPYGITNPMVAKAVKRRNYTVIGWSIRSFDTMIKDPERLFRRVTRPLQAGDIVLFHDYSDTTLQILPRFIAHVAKVGLKVVRVDELLNEKGYV